MAPLVCVESPDPATTRTEKLAAIRKSDAGIYRDNNCYVEHAVRGMRYTVRYLMPLSS
jgi:hypothetical protein